MRTIELVEYEPVPAELAPAELQQILTTDLVAVSPLPAAGAYELRAGSVVGTIVLRDVWLLIRPKVGLANLFFLLGFGAGITRWAPERFLYQSEPHLLDAAAWVFGAAVAQALKHGVAKGYQGREAALATLRGRLDVGRQARARQSRPYPLDCRFEEFTEDVALNRVLKAAHDRLLAQPCLDAAVAHRLRASRRAFSSVASVDYGPGAVPDLRFTRLDHHWEEAYRLARLILQQQSLRDRTGAALGSAFTVDVGRLFEQFVERVFREQAQRAGWHLEAQARRYLAAGLRIQPDIVLRRDGQDVAVADAKYKDPGDASSAAGAYQDDLYQLLAYCVALGLPAGLLIYAAPRPLVAHSVQRGRVRLEAVGVDLQAPPELIRRQVRAAAAHLIEQAGQTLYRRSLAG